MTKVTLQKGQTYSSKSQAFLAMLFDQHYDILPWERDTQKGPLKNEKYICTVCTKYGGRVGNMGEESGELNHYNFHYGVCFSLNYY